MEDLKMKNNNTLQVIDERVVLGKQFTIYGTVENPLFLAKEVAEWIEHNNVTLMVSKVDEEEKKLDYAIDSSGQRRKSTFLTEDGLYEVLMQSRKEIAKAFKKEVKHILKTIRKYGAFMTEATIEKVLTDPDFIIGLAKELQKEKNARIIAEKHIIELKAIVEVQKTKVKKYDTLIGTDGLFNLSEIAKIVMPQIDDEVLGRNKLIRFLIEEGILSHKTRLPYQKYLNKGLFAVKVSTNNNRQFTTTLVTRKGYDYLMDLFEFYEMVS